MARGDIFFTHDFTQSLADSDDDVLGDVLAVIEEAVLEIFDLEIHRRDIQLVPSGERERLATLLM